MDTESSSRATKQLPVVFDVRANSVDTDQQRVRENGRDGTNEDGEKTGDDGDELDVLVVSLVFEYGADLICGGHVYKI